ncbi:MAG: SRPBCC domain-containing protein [Phycisphaeraceae bacterium]|nr:SRPBCC domain-containing protein [Phycisphaeraceae bacterium]
MFRLIVCLAVSTAALAQDKHIPQPASAAAPAAVNTSPLTHEIDLNVPVSVVWDLFSTDEGFKKFGVAKAKVDCRIGGKILSHYDPAGELGDEGTIENTILAFEPMRMMAFRITKAPKGFPFMNAYKSTWSVATMTDLGGGRTRLRLTGLGYTADEESQRMRAFFDQGNAYTLDRLKQNLEGSSETARMSPAAPADDPLGPITVEATVNAMPRDVWKNWTTSDGFKSFLKTENRIDLRLGGPFEVYFSMEAPAGSRGSEGCTILSFDPERMLSFSWNAPPKFAHARGKHTWVVVHFLPHGAHGTKVVLRHNGFAENAAANPDHEAEWKEVRAYFTNAWPRVLASLSDHYKPKTATVPPK